MRFEKLDLNLLVALDALLTERSVSLAAERIFLSQSATSSALGRLREYFEDDLLVVKGRQMVLTARGEELIDPVRAVLEQIRMTISTKPQFDPAVSDRTMVIMASDYVTDVLLADVIADLEADAPHMRFEITPMDSRPIETLERRLIDMMISIDQAISDEHPSEVLFEDDYVVVGCKDNPAMRLPMTQDKYFELGHVTARFGKSRIPAFEDWYVRTQSLERRVEVVGPTFLSLPGLVVGTSRIATMHRRLAARVSRGLPVVIQPVPFQIPSVSEAAQWHVSNNSDQGLRWFIDRLKQKAAETASRHIEGEGGAETVSDYCATYTSAE